MQQNRKILVFGATGQQGGSVVDALLDGGWQASALVRDLDAVKARALADRGVRTIRGDLADDASLRAAMTGMHGVFSVQPSSGQGAAYGVSDEDEVRYGKAVADAAVAAGVRHLVYSSANAAGDTPTGMGHFDTKSEVEHHLRTLPISWTVVRPSAFMEILALPGLGLDHGTITFFMRPEQAMQFVAVRDIGRFVAAAFADEAGFAGRTTELAGDTVTGNQLGTAFSRALGRPVAYRRFSDQQLVDNGFLRRLAALVDDGRLAGNADLATLRTMLPGLSTLEDWLAHPGAHLLRTAASAERGDVALR